MVDTSRDRTLSSRTYRQGLCTVQLRCFFVARACFTLFLIEQPPPPPPLQIDPERGLPALCLRHHLPHSIYHPSFEPRGSPHPAHTSSSFAIFLSKRCLFSMLCGTDFYNPHWFDPASTLRLFKPKPGSPPGPSSSFPLKSLTVRFSPR